MNSKLPYHIKNFSIVDGNKKKEYIEKGLEKRLNSQIEYSNELVESSPDLYFNNSNRSPLLTINHALLSPIQSPNLTQRINNIYNPDQDINLINIRSQLVQNEFNSLPIGCKHALILDFINSLGPGTSYYNWFSHSLQVKVDFLFKLPIPFISLLIDYLNQDAALILVKLCHRLYHLLTPPSFSRIENRFGYAHGLCNSFWKNMLIKYKYLDNKKIMELNYNKYLCLNLTSKYDPNHCYIKNKEFKILDDEIDYYLLFNLENRRLNKWKKQKYEIKELNTHDGVITCIQFDKHKLVTGSDNNEIRVYNIDTLELLHVLEGHEGGVWALKFVDTLLVSGSTDRTIRIWDLELGINLHVFSGHSSTIRCLLLIFPSYNKNYQDDIEDPMIVSGSRDASLKVWKLPSNKSKSYYGNVSEVNPYLLHTLNGHTMSVRAIHSVSKYVISGSYDSTVRIWNIKTGECIKILRAHEQKVYSVLLSPDLSYAYSAGLDAKIIIWYIKPLINPGENTKLNTIRCWTLNGHISLVGLLQLSEVGLLSAAADGVIKVWDPNPNPFLIPQLDTLTSKQTLIGHIGAITCFYHDSYRVVSGSDNGIKLWWKDEYKGGYQLLYEISNDLQAVWQLEFDNHYCVAAVQKAEGTFVQVFSF